MSLSQYTNEPQTKLFTEAGVFFAFSNQQFAEARAPGVEYVSMGCGMICPVDKVQYVRSEMDRIYKEAIQQDINQNSKQSIIERELYNFECFYTGDIQDVLSALVDYEITEQEVWDEYHRLSATVEI